jgi:hypothetical protein
MFNNLAIDAASGVLSAGWTEVWHWGLGIGLVVVCFAAAWLSPVFKKDFFYAGVIIIVLLIVYGAGGKDATALCKAQEATVTKKVDVVVARTKTPKYRAKKDPYDDPRN